MHADNEVSMVTTVVVMSFLVMAYNWTIFSKWRLKYFFGGGHSVPPFLVSHSHICENY